MSEDTGSEKPKKPKKQPEVILKKKWKPTFPGTVEFVSHLFKLTDAKLKKKVIMGQGSDSIQDATHNHFFHTHDSSGKAQDVSIAVGGHFHVMEVSYDPETGEPTATCSGPKTYVFEDGRKVMVDLPSIGKDDRRRPVYDTHTHEVVYQTSARLRPRKLNTESVGILNNEANKTAPIPGISG